MNARQSVPAQNISGLGRGCLKRLSRSLSVLAIVFVAPIGGCKPDELQPYAPRAKKDYSRPLPPGQLALRKIPPELYPDFGPGFYNRSRLSEAIQHSLNYLSKPSSQKYYPYGDISHARAVASLRTFLEVMSSVNSPEELDRAIRERFEVYQSVGCDDEGTVFFTGYYCPIFEGRKSPGGRFRYPLYKLPADLVKDEEGNTMGRQTGSGIVPFYTRRQIEQSGMYRGSEIAWLKDPFEAYIATVQGSAKIRLEDGSIYEIGYAGNTGHPYNSVGQNMVERGLIAKDELSLQAMMRYFAHHPEQIQPLCWQNDRYVFFKEAPGGPFGSINVPVIPYRSIATDKAVFPRACLAFVTTQMPVVRGNDVQRMRYAAFACDQDTGGAIRAAGRCDLFVGVGDRAEAVAGRIGAEGALYYVFVKSGADGA